MEQKRTEYDEFLHVVKHFKSLSLVAVGAGGVVPFLAYVADFAPAWPKGIMLATVLVEIVFIILAFQILRVKSRRYVDKALVSCAVALTFFSLSYMIMLSQFTYMTPKTGERWNKGFVCTEIVQRTHPGQCPMLTQRIIADSEYEASLLWESWSITIVNVTIAALWFACFASLSTVVGGFISFQMRLRARNP